MEDGLNSTI